MEGGGALAGYPFNLTEFLGFEKKTEIRMDKSLFPTQPHHRFENLTTSLVNLESQLIMMAENCHKLKIKPTGNSKTVRTLPDMLGYF